MTEEGGFLLYSFDCLRMAVVLHCAKAARFGTASSGLSCDIAAASPDVRSSGCVRAQPLRTACPGCASDAIGSNLNRKQNKS